MHIKIILTKQDAAFLKKLIENVIIPIGFEDTHFKMNEKIYEEYRCGLYGLQENYILSVHSNGCGTGKFVFTGIGKAFLKKYNLEIGEKIQVSPLDHEPKNLEIEII